MGLSIVVENLSGKRVGIAALRARLRAAAGEEGIVAGDWRVSIVDDAAMRRLHRQTMQIGTTTDVLTFDLRETGPGKGLDLDTVLCRDVAARVAVERKHTILDELTLYAVHSLLHVCGYDDLQEKKAARMHRREDEILRAIGVGNVYASNRQPQKSRRG